MKEKTGSHLLLLLTLIMLMCVIFLSNISVISVETETINTDGTAYLITAESAQN